MGAPRDCAVLSHLLRLHARFHPQTNLDDMATGYSIADQIAPGAVAGSAHDIRYWIGATAGILSAGVADMTLMAGGAVLPLHVATMLGTRRVLCGVHLLAPEHPTDLPGDNVAVGTESVRESWMIPIESRHIVPTPFAADHLLASVGREVGP